MTVWLIFMPALATSGFSASMTLSSSDTGLPSEEAHSMRSGIRMVPSASVTLPA